METRLEAGDRDAARRLAHTLKGSSATLGAESLAASAARLDAMLRNESEPPAEDALAAELSAITREFDVLAAALRGEANGGS